MDGDAVEFRNALYASIHDRVNAHIDAKKVEIAQGLIGQQQVEAEEEEYEEEEQAGENS